MINLMSINKEVGRHEEQDWQGKFAYHTYEFPLHFCSGMVGVFSTWNMGFI
jgi:hypothetical protein